jgi:DNA end-binding protein Ku
VARPFWSGQLQISLVSFGVQLFPATNPASEISFHQIDRKSGKRIHHQNVVEGGEPVDRDEIVKGYEYTKGKFVVVEPKEIEKLRIESKRTIEVSQFVNLCDIPPALFERPYFVVPQEKGQAAAFAVVRKAMEQTGKAAIGEIAFSGREHLVAVYAAPGKNARGMMAYTLRYEEELRDASDYFSDIKSQTIDAGQLKMATQLIENYAGELDLSKFKDDYEAALRKLVEAKMKNKPLPVEEEAPKKAKVINLMDALRASLENKPRSGSAAKKAAKGKGGLKLVKLRAKRKSA